MVRKTFIQRSFQKLSNASNSKLARRAVLAALIAGTSFGTLSSAQANEVKPGGISILVHEFVSEAQPETQPEAVTPQEVATATEPATEHIAEPVTRIAALGTHDSVITGPEAIEEVETSLVEEIDTLELADTDQLEEAAELANIVEPEASVIKKASSQFDRTIAAAVAASAARLGISIEQVLEPFAMVGPIANQAPATMPIDVAFSDKAVIAADDEAIAEVIEDVTGDIEPTNQQLAEAVALNRWWLDTETVAVATASSDEIAKASEVLIETSNDAVQTESAGASEQVAQAEQSAIEDTASRIEAAIEELAAEEPLDVQDKSSNVGDAKLVGSSPMIVTIQDAYMPYDLAQRDLELNLLPLSTVLPITPKNYVESSIKPSMPSAEEVVAVESPAAPAIEVVANAETTTPVEEKIVETKLKASPECLLDELVHDASELADATQIRDLTFAGLGESFGEWVASLSPKRAELAKDVAPAVVVGSAVLHQASTELGEAKIVTPEVAEVPSFAPESAVVAVDAADEKVAADVAELAMMEVNREAIPAPVADPIPNAEEALEIAKTDLVPVMEIDGKIVPAPVADPAPNASDVSDQIAVMEVEGKVIPAPVADPLPNAEPEQIASSKADSDEMAVAEPVAESIVIETVVAETVVAETVVAETVVAEDAIVELAKVQLGTPVVNEPEANIADLIATINQWQQEAINAILASPLEASPEASEAVIEVAEKVEAPSETKLR